MLEVADDVHCPKEQVMPVLHDLQGVARHVLRTCLAGADRVALVNFPDHGNPGDPAIWLGTRRLLAEIGVEVAHSTAWWDFDARALRRAVGDAPVVLNGGGNFGDLYRGQQSTRERVLRELTDNAIVQAPQSILFRDRARADEVAALIAAHGGVELVVRERLSLARARAQLGVEAHLSPDHALALGPWERTAPVTGDILWLARRPGDPEYVEHGEPTGDDVRRIEWLEGIDTAEAAWDLRGRALLALDRRARAAWDSGARWPRVLQPAVSRTFEPLARRWVDRGRAMLSASRVVVTDKLHGHIFCVLAGIEHVVLDNSYGKVSGTLEAWTGSLPGVHHAPDGPAALALARRLVAEAAS